MDAIPLVQLLWLSKTAKTRVAFMRPKKHKQTALTTRNILCYPYCLLSRDKVTIFLQLWVLMKKRKVHERGWRAKRCRSVKAALGNTFQGLHRSSLNYTPANQNIREALLTETITAQRLIFFAVGSVSNIQILKRLAAYFDKAMTVDF